MNTFHRIALALGSATLLTSSIASAVPAHIPAGNYGDPGVATFDVTTSGATIELPCSNIAINGIIIIDDGKFSTKGEETSNLPFAGSKPAEKAVEISGTINSDDHVVKMSVEVEGQSAVEYTFTLGEAGVGIRCE